MKTPVHRPRPLGLSRVPPKVPSGTRSVLFSLQALSSRLFWFGAG
jgi:hypothetical protein